MDDGALCLLALEWMLDIDWDATCASVPMTCVGPYLHDDFQRGIVSGYTAPVRAGGGEPVKVEPVYRKYARYRTRPEETENEV